MNNEIPERIWMIGNWPNATFACLPGNLDEVEYARVRVADDRPAGEPDEFLLFNQAGSIIYGVFGAQNLDSLFAQKLGDLQERITEALKIAHRSAAPPHDWAREPLGVTPEVAKKLLALRDEIAIFAKRRRGTRLVCFVFDSRPDNAVAYALGRT